MPASRKYTYIYTLAVLLLTCLPALAVTISETQINRTRGIVDITIRESTLPQAVHLKTAISRTMPVTRISSGFPGNQPAHVLMLLDTSLTMKGKPLQSAVKSILTLKKILPDNTLITVARFDGELKIITRQAPGTRLDENRLLTLKATGKRTELYRLALKGAEWLISNKARRPTLVIFSDGRYEDTGYNIKDVISHARNNNIVIHSVGYHDSVHLQSLRRMSQETGGHFIVPAGNEATGTAANMKIQASLLNGGTIRVSYSQYKGDRAHPVSIDLVLGYDNGVTTRHTVLVLLPPLAWYDRHYFGIRAIWLAAAAAGLLVLLLAIISIVRRARRPAEQLTCPACNAPVESGWTYCRACSTPLGNEKMLAQLVAIDGMTATWPISRAFTQIGRLDDNDLQLKSDSVGRRHATLILKDGQFIINDLGSANTVLVNDKPVTNQVIQHGDILDIGGIRLRFETLQG